MTSEFEDLLNKIQDFSDARDWSQFHTIKNLILAVSAEVGELAEVIQWKTDEEAAAYLNTPEGKNKLSEEVADTAIYLLRICQQQKLNFLEILNKKIITCDNNLHILAANKGDLELAQELILSGKYGIDEANEGGFTPLLLAVISVNPELVSLLLKYGADVNCEQKIKEFKLSDPHNENPSDSYLSGNNPLMFAMEFFVDRSKQEKITQKDVEYDKKIKL
jgi:dCTP diphosphatase